MILTDTDNKVEGAAKSDDPTQSYHLNLHLHLIHKFYSFSFNDKQSNL